MVDEISCDPPDVGPVKEPSVLGSIRLEPSGSVVAGSEGRWVFVYTAGAKGISVGGSLVIRSPKISAAPMHLFDWDFGQVRCYSSSRARLVASVRDFDDTYSPAIAVTVRGSALRPGEEVHIVLGDVSRGSFHRLARAQWVVHPNVGFTAWVDMDGSGELVPLPDYPRTEIVAGPAHRLRAVVPAVAAPAERTRILVCAEDRYTNVATECNAALTVAGAAADTSLRLEGGRCEADGLRLAGSGVRRVTASAEGAQVTAVSNACWDAAIAGKYDIYFGDLHAQMCKDPSQYPYAWVSGDPAALYDYARNVAGLDFVAHVEVGRPSEEARRIAERLFGPRDADRGPVAQPARRSRVLKPTLSYADRLASAAAHNEPGRFVAFAAYEWGGRPCHRNVVFRDEPGNCFCGAARTPQELCACRREDRVPSISIPHTINGSDDHSRWDQDRTLDADGYFDYGKRYHVSMPNWGPLHWDQLDTESEPVVELCQSRGSFETDEAGNGVVLGGFGASAQHGLALGKRVGFVAGTDTHLGRPGGRDCFGPTWDDRRGAITGVLAPELTRESLFDAICARRCYAATDRILLDVQLNGHLMGKGIEATEAEHRTVHVRVSGTCALESVDIVRNNENVATFGAGELDLQVDWDDPDSLEELLAYSPNGSVWYYVRVRQTDGEMAWSSPIWIVPSLGA